MMPELGEPISERELDVLSCLAEGASNREIADRLSISHNTVKVHVRNIFTKLGVSSRTEATTVALQKGMLIIPGIEMEPVQEEDGQGNGPQPAVVAVAEPAELSVPAVNTTEAVEAQSGMQTDGAQQRGFFSRRYLLGVIGLLTILVIVLALGNMLNGSARTLLPSTLAADAAPTTVAFEEAALGDNWVESRALPEARSRMALATVGLNIYAIAGEGSDGVDNTVLIFDSQQQQWQEGAPKLTAVANASAGVLAGEIYVAGGFGGNGLVTTAVEAYSPLNDAWRPVTALPQPVAGALAIASDGLLYLFGGEDGNTVLGDSYVYDPGTQQWQSLPPMQEARTMAVGGVLGGKLYVVGGSDGNQALASCELFDPQISEWSECPALEQARSAAGSAVFLNKLYVLGGEVQGEEGLGEVYDPAQQHWSPFSMPMLAEASDWPYLGVSNVETHIYAMGGERGGQLSDQLYVYRPLVYQFFIPAASAGGGE